MPEVLENPVIKEDVIPDDLFLEAASKADRGEDIPADISQPKQEEPQAAAEPEAVTTEQPEEKPKADRPRDELGRFTKTETGEDIPENERQPSEQQHKPETKPESAYTRAQKERERQENLLKNFQSEKEQFRAETERIREQLKREAAELQRAREQRTNAPASNSGATTRYSSAELLDAAEEFDNRAEQAIETGDPEAFKEARRLAKDARAQAGQVKQLEAQAGHQAQVRQFQQVYTQTMEAVLQKEPDLWDAENRVAKTDTPLAKEVMSLLEQEQLFSHDPYGFAKAVAVAKWKRDAGAASELRETNKRLQAEVDRLNGLTQLNGSGPTPAPSQKTFDTMSEEEKDKYLLRQAQRFDQGE